MDDFEFDEPEFNWDDDFGGGMVAHAGGRGEPDLEWDDPEQYCGGEFLPHVDLNTSRDAARERFVKEAKPKPKSIPVEQAFYQFLSDISTDNEEEEDESIDKFACIASNTYKDFLLFKRNESTRARVKTFKRMGIDRPEHYHTIAGGDEEDFFIKDDKDDSRRKTFGFEGFTTNKAALKGPDLEKILREGPINWDFHYNKKPDPTKTKTEQEIDFLVEDQYFPGLLDDCINGKLDFAKIAFDRSFPDGKIPDIEPAEAPPLSLVEAFDLRVAKEKGARKKIMKLKDSVLHKQEGHEEQPEQTFAEFLQEQNRLEQTTAIDRDEIALANVAEIDIATMVKNQPVNELTAAINSLEKAELLNDYHKSLQAAEEAYQAAPRDLAETAAVERAQTFKVEELTKKVAKTSVYHEKSYRPIEIVSYMGITKPVRDDYSHVKSRIVTR